ALWASSKLPAIVPEPMRQRVIDDTFKAQQSDGGWTIESLGPWHVHADAPQASGSRAYATAFVAHALKQANVAPSDPHRIRAQAWLRSHQDTHSGAWPDVSMNKHRQLGSMEESFMQDAATAFAVLALLND